MIIGFSKPKKWMPFSWLIQTAYNIPYDHVYLRINLSELGSDIIFQASSTMVNFMGAIEFANKNDVVKEFTIEMSDENKKAMMLEAFALAGTPYGVKECFGLAWVKIMSWFGKSVKNPFAASTQTEDVCSQLVSQFLITYAGMTLPKDPADMTPLDVYQFMSSLKST